MPEPDTHSESRRDQREQPPGTPTANPTSPPPEMSGSAEESLRAAEGLSAGPEVNTHPDHPGQARDLTGTHATDEWKHHPHRDR